MRSKAGPIITCLCNWIIHIHIVTSHYIGLASLKYITTNSLFNLSVILSSLFAQIYPQLLVLELLTYMCAGFTLCSRLVSASSTQIVPKGKYKVGK